MTASTTRTAPVEPRNPAEAYQAYYGPAIFEPLSDHVARFARPMAGERILDVACGTGILTRRLAAEVGGDGRIVGVDLNPAMLAVAAQRGNTAAGAIEWLEGDGTALPVPTGGFDLVVCQQGLQFFDDRERGVAEMARALAPGGRAVVAVWRGPEEHPLLEALADAELPHLAELDVGITAEDLIAPFSLGSVDELERLLTGAGFADLAIERVSIEARFADADRFVERLEFAYAAVIPQFAADPEAFARYLARITDDTREVVEAHRRDDAVVVPMHAHVAVGRQPRR